MAERTALYAGTRNLYHDMVTACKSLLYHNGADRVIFLTEDDTFPESLPACITTLNVSTQTYFPRTGPNYTCRWTYMSFMRCAITKLFPNLSRVLTLDVDTIVNKPIDYLWDIDITPYYLAMAEEKQIKHRNHPYFNFGVTLQNLDKLRQDEADNTIISTINNVWMQYPEQDAVNSVCHNHILELPPAYNAIWFNIPPVPKDEQCISHYAMSGKGFRDMPGYSTYESMSWDEILAHKDGDSHA